MRILLSTPIAILIVGCAVPQTIRHLNDPTKSVQMTDIASLSEPKDIPYEIQTLDSIVVGYNLTSIDSGPAKGMRLTLYLRNEDSRQRELRPTVSLSDKNGLIIPAYSYQAFVNEATILAGTAIPPTLSSKSALAPTGSTTTGTIRNTTTGTSYSYEAKTDSNRQLTLADVADSYAEGASIRQARNANEARITGQTMLRWANAFWLRDVYTISPARAAGGAIYFPQASQSQLPLNLVVDVAGRKFEFSTKSSSR